MHLLWITTSMALFLYAANRIGKVAEKIAPPADGVTKPK
jgi:hypothetical protein